MNRQRIFNTVLTALREQRVASGTIVKNGPLNNFEPHYYSSNGCKCAIGHLIPRSVYHPLMEGMTLTGLFERAIHYQLPDYFYHEKVLLRELQYAHDKWMPRTRVYTTAYWESIMATVAKNFGLMYKRPKHEITGNIYSGIIRTS